MDNEDLKQAIWRGIMFTLGVSLLAFCYNLFFLPKNIVIGGTTGLALIFNNIFGINPTIFIYTISLFLLLISFIFLGWKKTKNTIVGSLLYPLMISVTSPIASLIINKVTLDDMLLEVLIAGIIYGISSGLVYKSGFTTGGSDVIIQLMTKYLKMPDGKAAICSNIIIIVFGGLVFGLVQVIYAIIILYIGALLIDRILIGISESKVFYIYTREIKKVKKMIIDELHAGYTVLPTIGGYSHTKGQMIMCVISTKDYYLFKEKVLNIDPDAFFVINDCYEVNGGVKKKNLPFI